VVGFLGYVWVDSRYGGLRRVEGPSMSPTLNLNEYDEVKVSDQHTGPGSFNDLEQYNDFVLFSRRATIARGDVVVLDDPKNESIVAVKRVIGLPGDRVTPLGFNQKLLEPVVLEKGQVWVESDSWGYRDSNLYGPVPVSCLQGKVVAASKLAPWLLLQTTRWVESGLPAGAAARLSIAHHNVAE